MTKSRDGIIHTLIMDRTEVLSDDRRGTGLSRTNTLIELFFCQVSDVLLFFCTFLLQLLFVGVIALTGASG